MLGRMIVRWQAVREAARGPVVTHALIAGCCVVFVLSPASGLNPVYGTGDQLLTTGTAYFRRWGVVPDELFTGSGRAALTPSRPCSSTGAGCTCWATCSSSTSSGR